MLMAPKWRSSVGSDDAVLYHMADRDTRARYAVADVLRAPRLLLSSALFGIGTTDTGSATETVGDTWMDTVVEPKEVSGAVRLMRSSGRVMNSCTMHQRQVRMSG